MIYLYVIIALAAYLLGSIPFGYILVRLFLKQDIRATGSGNIGATNVARSGAKGLAIATLLLDALKGYLAVMFAFGFANSIFNWCVPGRVCESAVLLGSIAATGAIAGHMFPIWLKFRGGKGVATGVGAFAALAPLAIGVVFLFFVATVAVTRFVSLGSILAAALFPVFAHFLNGYSGMPLLLMSAASFLIILKHHENIRRLLAGTENKFGAKKSAPPPDAVEKQA